MTVEHAGMTYEEVAVPIAKMSLIFPRNHFTAKILNGHAELSISTDLAGIPAIKDKIDALAALMAIEMVQPDIIVQHSVERGS
jgi:hypothetical protein